MSKAYEQYSEQEKAIVFATCAELEGVLAGISSQHEFKVIPAFLWEDMTKTIALLKERLSQLEGKNEVVKPVAILQGNEATCPAKTVRPDLHLCK